MKKQEFRQTSKKSLGLLQWFCWLFQLIFSYFELFLYSEILIQTLLVTFVSSTPLTYLKLRIASLKFKLENKGTTQLNLIYP